MYADAWLTKVAFDACLLPRLIRLIALSYNLRTVNLLQYQYIRLRMSFRNEFFWRGIQNHRPLTRHCKNFTCWRCFSTGFERHFSLTNVSLFDSQSRLPILHRHVRKKKLFSSKNCAQGFDWNKYMLFAGLASSVLGKTVPEVLTWIRPHSKARAQFKIRGTAASHSLPRMCSQATIYFVLNFN